MADFTTPNLQGANEKLNKALTDATALKDKLLAEHGGEASSILATLQSAVADLISSLGSLIPELPEIPNVNMQSDFTQLANFDISTPDGLSSFTAQKASLEAQFGDALDAKGIDLDSVASQMNSLSLEDATAQIGDLVPNLQLPAGETIPIELPANIAQASEQAAKETISKSPTLSMKTETITISEITEQAGKNIVQTTKKYTEVKEKTTVSGGTETLIEAEPSVFTKGTNKRKTKSTFGAFMDEGEEEFQRFSDQELQRKEDKTYGVMDYAGYKFRGRPYVLNAAWVRKWFENPDDDGTEEFFIKSQEQNMDGWSWREDSEERFIYDRRYNKNSKIT
tara:strand:+ start:409 stop:1422 length:1014 start_codon:yes stop_codon:yes gene_type:complete